MNVEDLNRKRDYSELMNLEEGWLSRRVFWDQDIYEAEMQNVFARSWLFVAHESQIPNPNDFLTTYMGEDGVIVSRQRDMSIEVMLNSCPHRGNKVCFADGGNARRFVCNYHGWGFNTNGSLAGMHEDFCYDPEDLNRDTMGLKKARVASYKGLVFATFDQTAPSLDDFLGDYRWYLDIILDTDEDGSELIGGTVKFEIPMNWKLGAENFVGDSYHAGWAHDSGAKAMTRGMAFPPLDFDNTFHASALGHGHEFGMEGIGNTLLLGSEKVTDYFVNTLRPRMMKRLGERRSMIFGSIASASIFPNVSYLPAISTFRTWLPKGPHKTELRTWVIVNKRMPNEIKDEIAKCVMKTFGPSGSFEMDDGENWENCTITNRGLVTRNEKLHYRCGINRQMDHPELPGTVYRGQYNDANQRLFHQRWLDMMTAKSWADIPERGGNRLKGLETRDLHNGIKGL